MPRYFFDVSDGDTILVADTEGQEMSAEEARREAIGVLPQYARDVLPDGDERVFVCYVHDGQGRGIFRARLMLSAQWLVDPGSLRGR